MEAGTKAFLSYVRAYKEHHCRFIFRLQARERACVQHASAGGLCLLWHTARARPRPSLQLLLSAPPHSSLQDLQLGRLASAFALLRLPRMPEIKGGGRGLEGFTPSTVDPDTGAWVF